MQKKFIKNYIPNHSTLLNSKILRIFGSFINSESSIFQLNRNSVSRGAAIGVFSAFLPMPFQMIVAMALSLIFRANAPLSIALVWVTNPLTIPPIFYFCYKIGAYVLNVQLHFVKIQFSLDWASSQFLQIWKPLLLGSFICGIIGAIIAYFTINTLWKISIIKKWNKRKFNRRNALINQSQKGEI